MIDQDENLDRLLSHLTSVEPEHGFEQRILHGIAASRLQRQPRPDLWLRWSCASAAALACALAGALITVHQRPAAPVSSRVANASPAVPQPTTVAVEQPTPARSARHLLHRAAQRLNPVDFPAPEPPLTLEEKLLLRVSHHDPDQVAILNPEERAELELRDQVAFQQFFDPEPRPKRANN